MILATYQDVRLGWSLTEASEVSVLRILVIGSCGKKKRTSAADEPSCSELLSNDALAVWQKRLSSATVIARDMYTGNQNRELAKGVDLLRTVDEVDVVFVIVSAGFGLVSENELVPPYDCTFSGMGKSEILRRSRMLGINSDINEVAQQGFDIAYLALGKDYLTALGGGWQDSVSGSIVAFSAELSGEKYAILPSGNEAVKSFSSRGHKIHGATGLKGDLLRILAEHALHSPNPYDEILSWSEPLYIRDLIVSLGSLQSIMS